MFARTSENEPHAANLQGEVKKSTMDNTWKVTYSRGGSRVDVKINACSITKGGIPKWAKTVELAAWDLMKTHQDQEWTLRTLSVDWCTENKFEKVIEYFEEIRTLYKVILVPHKHDELCEGGGNDEVNIGNAIEEIEGWKHMKMVDRPYDFTLVIEGKM